MMPNTRAQDTSMHLRNANTHTSTYTRTTSYQKSFIPTTSTQWNKLPNATQQLKHTAFKKRLREQLGVSDPPMFFTLGSKFGNILHSRLRMNMTCLNSHLYTVQKTVTPSCACGNSNETISHFTLSCPNYTEQRNILFKNLSEELLPDFKNKSTKCQLEILLFGTELSGGVGRLVAMHFQNFLLKTERFENQN